MLELQNVFGGVVTLFAKAVNFIQYLSIIATMIRLLYNLTMKVKFYSNNRTLTTTRDDFKRYPVTNSRFTFGGDFADETI